MVGIKAPGVVKQCFLLYRFHGHQHAYQMSSEKRQTIIVKYSYSYLPNIWINITKSQLFNDIAAFQQSRHMYRYHERVLNCNLSSLIHNVHLFFALVLHSQPKFSFSLISALARAWYF